MKLTYKICLLCGFAASGCADYGAQEKAALDSVIKVHDKVMGEDEQLMKNKVMLDSLAKSNVGSKDSTAAYLSNIVQADNTMDTWMHNFNPDLTGKPHDVRMSYLEKQEKLIVPIEREMKSALNASDAYLAKMKKK